MEIYTRSTVRLRNQVRRITRNAQRNHERSIAKQAKNNHKKFWSYASTRSKKRKGVPQLSRNGDDKGTDLTTCDKEKAEVLSKFFASAFTIESEESLDLPLAAPPSAHLTLTTISGDQVQKALAKLKISKSAGQDGLHPCVLYELRDVLVAPSIYHHLQHLPHHSYYTK